MGGYKVKRKTFVLDFTGTEYEGLEVRTRSASMDVMIGLVRMARELDPANLDPELVNGLLDKFAVLLVSWNLEDDDDVAVPATREGLGGLDFTLSTAIVLAWVEGVAGVPGPLGRPSTAGLPSEAVPLPMEPLSPSLAS